ncbi:ABC transporter substrate-binding protein [Methylosoma difficile]
MTRILFFFIALSLTATNNWAGEKTTLRIGAQASGTLAWELSNFPADNDTFQIQAQTLANAEAGKIALQSGAVDMIIADWLWVAAMRDKGTDYVFYPYSSTSGALMVAGDSPIHSIADLQGKRLGIAGGELDKNWLLLKAAAQQQHIDLSGNEKTFGAPPLINEQLKQGRVDAALNYWHFAAKLEAQGYRQILGGKDLLKAIGIPENLPTLGFVFRKSWASAHQAALNKFFLTSKNTKDHLCNDAAAWQQTQAAHQETDPAIVKTLQIRYCEGRTGTWGANEQQAASQLYQLLGQLSQQQLTGTASHLPTDLVWTNP